MKVLLTGDMHGSLPPFLPPLSEPTAIIALGDAGVNFFGEGTIRDRLFKQELQDTGFIWYLLRGNHEMRPRHLSNIKTIDDDFINSRIQIEEEYPNIRYLEDYWIYTINGLKVGVIGGAYSIDKEWRLLNNIPWFPDEQLNAYEKNECGKIFIEQGHFDVVLSHTCPFEWMPRDLFIDGIDQSMVDNSMEHFLSEIKKNITFDKWFFGHYHADRIINPKAQMIYRDFIELPKGN